MTARFEPQKGTGTMNEHTKPADDSCRTLTCGLKMRLHWWAFAGALLGTLTVRACEDSTTTGAGCTPCHCAEATTDVRMAVAVEQVTCQMSEKAQSTNRIAIDCAPPDPVAAVGGGTAPLAAPTVVRLAPDARATD
jgi:hypothetical protein